MVKILVISSSLDPKSRSRVLAKMCHDGLSGRGTESNLLDLRDVEAPNFDNDTIYGSRAYQDCHAAVSRADALVLASPIYNWGVCAELKKFVEFVGSTPPDRTLKGAFYDKVLMFVNTGGLPHSYMGFTSFAMAMMLDFKCIVSPYNVYVDERCWTTEATLDERSQARLDKSMDVLLELAERLQGRTYSSSWEI